MISEGNNDINSLEKYRKWLQDELDVSITYRDEIYYQKATEHLVKDLVRSKFWTDVSAHIKDFQDSYKFEKAGHQLLMDINVPELCIKPYESLIIKSFRKNVLNNVSFPKSPAKGWLVPENWLTNVNDVIRTTFVVKYLDGVEYLVNELREIAANADVKFTVDYEAREEGYYAAHINVTQSLETITQDFNLVSIEFTFEIQITTQLQDNIKTLLHKFYESNRKSVKVNDKKWQWDHKSSEFNSNYLGHILHYVEGMIVDLRDKQNNNIK